jgi:DNA-binding NtrC family response regulator
MSREARLAPELTNQAAPRSGQYEKSGPWSGHLALEGKAMLILEDEPLTAMNVELCLLDAGAAVVKIANSIASAKSALDEGIPFDAAVVDLCLADGNASTLIQALSERGIAVVITTGDAVPRDQPADNKAITVLQKPYTDRELINALMKCAAALPSVPPATPYSIT